MIAFTGTGLVRQLLEIVEGEGRLTLFVTTFSASEQEAKAALPYVGMDAVQRLRLGQEGECLTNGAATFCRQHQVEQGFEILGMGASPGLCLGFGTLRVTPLVVMSHQGAVDLRHRVSRARPL